MPFLFFDGFYLISLARVVIFLPETTGARLEWTNDPFSGVAVVNERERMSRRSQSLAIVIFRALFFFLHQPCSISEIEEVCGG